MSHRHYNDGLIINLQCFEYIKILLQTQSLLGMYAEAKHISGAAYGPVRLD
jgi:hypothetical protein